MQNWAAKSKPPMPTAPAPSRHLTDPESDAHIHALVRIVPRKPSAPSPPPH